MLLGRQILVRSTRRGVGAIIAFAALLLLACGGAQKIEAYTESPCPRASEGNSCVTFNYSVKPETRKNVKGTLKGIVRWAVHNGGDVGLFGPGNSRSLWGGDEMGVDLSEPDSSVNVVIDNVPSARYQVVAYIDENDNFINDGGEVVTFPKDPFFIPANRDITVKILFDFIR